MKFIVLFLCLAQYSLGYPQEPQAIVENVQQTFAAIQEQSSKAVAELNSRLLGLVGVKSNEELLNTVQTQAQSFVAQIKGVADRINTQAETQKVQVDANIASLAKELSDSAAQFLSGNDPAKADSVQKTFSSVLEQANNLQRTVQAQGKNLIILLMIKKN